MDLALAFGLALEVEQGAELIAQLQRRFQLGTVACVTSRVASVAASIGAW